MKGIDKMTAGRVQLLFSNVFFGVLATNLKLIETDQLPTAGTDGKSLMFNPEFTDKLTKEEIIFLVAHEVMHLVLLTHVRMGNKDHKVWNMATDYAINLILQDEKFHTIEGSLLEEKYRDWTAEKIYTYLMDNPEEQPGGGTNWNIGEVQAAGTAGDEGSPGSAPPMTAEGLEAEAANMKAKVKAAVMSAKKAGNMSGGLDRLIDEICAPKANWKEILSRFVRQLAMNDWDYSKCHTRILHSTGIISPIIGGHTVGRIGIIVDTSGSVDEKQLAQFGGEISDILENYDCEVDVIYCDTQVNRVDKFTQDDLPLKMSAVGGGGTCGRPAYDWIAEQLDEVEAIIHYTDSYLFDWDRIEEPSCPTLMACTEENPDRSTPDWIEVIDISD